MVVSEWFICELPAELLAHTSNGFKLQEHHYDLYGKTQYMRRYRNIDI